MPFPMELWGYRFATVVSVVIGLAWDLRPIMGWGQDSRTSALSISNLPRSPSGRSGMANTFAVARKELPCSWQPHALLRVGHWPAQLSLAQLLLCP